MLRIAEEYMRDNKELFDALGAEKPIDTSRLPKNDVVNHLLKSLPKTDIGMAEQIDIIGRIAHDHLK